MNNETVELSFGQLLKLAIDGKTTALPVAPSVLHKTAHGGILHLPVDGERLAVSADAVPVTPSVGRISWLETAANPVVGIDTFDSGSGEGRCPSDRRGLACGFDAGRTPDRLRQRPVDCRDRLRPFLSD